MSDAEKMISQMNLNGFPETQLEELARLRAENAHLREALETMIGASVGYIMVNTKYWSQTAGQSKPTVIDNATFVFDQIILDCVHQLELGMSK